MTEEQKTNKNGAKDIRAGVALILLGALFLLQRTGVVTLTNWWAFFILIPAFSAFWGSIALWRKRGRFDAAVWSTMQGGFFPLLVAIIFLFDLRWDTWWPLFILLAGINLFISGLVQLVGKRETPDHFWRRHRAWATFTGLALCLLGLCFLGISTGWFAPDDITETWWAWCMVIPALGGLVTAVRLAGDDRFGSEAWMNLGAAAVIAVPGMVAIVGSSWNLVTPLVIIAVGVVLLLAYYARRDEPE